MHPIFLQIGNFTIRSYGFMAMLGFLTGWLFIRLNRKHAGLTEDQASNLLLIAMITGILGARIFYVVQFWNEQFAPAPWWMVLRIDRGGLVFYGGFLLALASVIGYCRWRRLDVVRASYLQSYSQQCYIWPNLHMFFLLLQHPIHPID